METKQQTDENTETPLNNEHTDTLAQGGDVENNTIGENNGDSDIKSENPEADGLKDENAKKPTENKPSAIPISINKKWSEWIKSNPITTLFITVIAGLIVIAVPKIIVHFRCYTREYITFESDFTQVFRLSDSVPNLEYSVGESRWKVLGDQNIVFGGSRGKLMLRGKNERGTDWANISFATDAQVICTGDIRTLIDYKNYLHTDTKQASFSFLFDGCSQLVVAPELPAMALADECYSYMFAGCTSLKIAPELPATSLAERCYDGMFKGCTSLKIAPALPATALADGCYLDMFVGCTSLEVAPVILAKVLANWCYSGMFSGCTSLKIAPILRATALAVGCYFGMFSGCTSLEFAPELPATTLANGCYGNMFRGCTSLKRAPVLPAKTLAAWCYARMFSCCTSLETASELPATSLADRCYSSMFAGCTSLEVAPNLPSTSLADGCYEGMFAGCSSLSSVFMMAVDVDKDYFGFWLDGTSPTGTFYKNENAQWSNDGIVPENWEVRLI